RALNDNDGLHVLGLTLKPAPTPAATAPAEAPAPAPATPPDAASAAPAAPAPPFRLDEFLVRGLDLRIEDRTGPVPTLLPLDSLDVELRDLRLHDGSATPMRFAVFAGAGDVPLPERQVSSSLLAGMVGAAGNALLGRGGELKMVERPLLDELAAQGELTLGDVPTGRVRVSLADFELTALRGIAEAAGVQIGDGLLDLGLDVTLGADRRIEIDSRTTLTHLAIDEPPGGPIERYLSLPAPLQTVVFALRDADGEIAIPVDLTLDEDGISGGQIATLATRTLSSVLTDAFLGSPFRVTGAVTGLLGLDGDGSRPDLPVETVTFETAEAALRGDDLAIVDRVAERLADDDELVAVVQSELGRADWQRAEILANPRREDALALIARLRQNLRELRRDRDVLAAEARAHYAVGRLGEAQEATRRLRGLDGEIGRLDQSIDRLVRIVRPGAERGAGRRTEDAAAELAEQRLGAVRDRLLEALRRAGVADPERRVELRNPRARREAAADQAAVRIAFRIRRAT
ncbi:MAG: hypothetical protein IPM29_18005, partial [Planctomycetes bacterium]|nr:hypothetical protein [Planctomycetota bacterium]